MKAVVLAGGKGRRLLPYTTIIPKPLMPIGDMPILEIMLRQMKSAGIDEVILTVGHLAELLHSYFQDGSRLGLHISYSQELTPLGTAGPLALINNLDEPFLVTNGDILTTLSLPDLLDFHTVNKAAATIAIHQRIVDVNLGVVKCDDNNCIVDYIEKPKYDYLVSMGIYVLDPSVLSFIARDQYLDFPNLIHILLDKHEKVMAYPFEGYWQDLGRPEDYEQATMDFEKMREQFIPKI